MKSFEWIIYDIIVVWITAGTIISSYKKGFSKIIISVCGYIAVCVIAALVSNILASPIYEMFVKQSVIDNISETVNKYSISSEVKEYISDITYGLDISEDNIEKTISSSDIENFDKNMYNLIIRHSAGAVSSTDEVSEGITSGLNKSMNELFKGVVPQSLTKSLVSHSLENKESAFEIIKMLTVSDSKKTAEHIEKNYIKQYAVSVTGMFVFILLFFILMFIVKKVEASIVNSDKISEKGKFNSFAGALLGIVEAAAYIFIMSVLVKFSMMLLDDVPLLLNEETIQNTKLFSIVYNFDILG